MTTRHFPRRAGSSKPLPDRVRPVEVTQLLLWASVALVTCAAVFILVLGPGKAMFREAVSLELAPGSTGMLQQALAPAGSSMEDPFYQKKLDAKADELPAQF